MSRSSSRLICAGIVMLAADILSAQGASTEAKAPNPMTDATLVDKQLDRLPGLNFSFSTGEGDKKRTVPTFAGLDLGKDVVFLELTNPPADLIANYRFPGDRDADLRPLAQSGVSKRVPVPSWVNMVLVELTWCNGCPVSQTTNPPAYTCPGAPVPKEQTTSAAPSPCKVTVIFVKDLIAKTPDKAGRLLPGFIISSEGLLISEGLLEIEKSRGSASYVLNGTWIGDYDKQAFPDQHHCPDGLCAFGWTFVTNFHFQRFAPSTSCRPYSPADESSSESIDATRKIAILGAGKDNGITVAPVKAFDTFTLRQMLASTASQLAGISGFSQSSIFGAFGNLQGVSRDASYVNAQVTTVPTATVASTAVNGATGSNTATNSVALTNGTTGTTTTLTCPPGTLPSIGSSGEIAACAPLVGGSSPTGNGQPGGGYSQLIGTGSNTGVTVNNGTTAGQTTNQQNTVTTTSGGQAGTVAPIAASTALTAPTNIGVSSSDVLAEQVQLNSQITTLRLLLQGALSDQYLVKGGRAVATRQQATVGFQISLNPPPRYKHAVAEVKIWVEAPDGSDPVSVMNLLPADKTYNVAKVTSRQNAFGAGAVVEPVNVGVSTGRSKDRLYLAKDTDTVALQFKQDNLKGKPKSPPAGADLVPRSARENVGDFFRQATAWQTIENACDDDLDPRDSTVVFGWQFRPVLGADYVQGGQRLVYAQLALPLGLGEQFAARVHIQTRWREYDYQRQVAGPVYKGSCSVSDDQNPIAVLSPLKVHNVTVDDMGGGILKVSAEGNFFSSSYSVLSGPNTIAPATFDGKHLQFFSNAQTLLMSDDLKLLAEDGSTTPLGISALFPANCNIASASITAVPRPDGNSLVEAKFTSGSRFALNADRDPRPLVLIGAQVYGLRETPFIGDGSGDGCQQVSGSGISCQYHFLASTDVLRAAQTFTVRDLAWREFKARGPIDLDPAFTALTTLGTCPAPSTGGAAAPALPVPPPVVMVNGVVYTPAGGAAVVAAPPPPSAPKCNPVYTLSGFQFDKIDPMQLNYPPPPWNCNVSGCFEVYQGLNQFQLRRDINFQVVSKTTATLQFPDPPPDQAQTYKSLRFIWHPTTAYPTADPFLPKGVEWDLSIPQDPKTAVTASTILNVGDSTQVVFSGVDLSGPPTIVTFEYMQLPSGTFTYDSTKKTLTVLITSAMTAAPGHKELTVTDPKAATPPKQIQLPFDVTKR